MSDHSELFDLNEDGEKMHVRQDILDMIFTEVKSIQARIEQVEKNLKRAIIVLQYICDRLLQEALSDG